MSTTMTPMHPAAGGFTPGLLPPLAPSPAEKTAAGSRRRHAALAVLSAFTALLLFLGLAFHGYVAWVIAHPYVPALTTNPFDAKGLAYGDVAFPSKSGQTTVHGWYIPAGGSFSAPKGKGADGTKLAAAAAGKPSGTKAGVSTAASAAAATAAVSSDRTVVFSHGYGANREETWVPMYDLAELLHGLHYNVFMFDYGYASSGKRTPATGGQEESQQLLAAVQYARSQGAGEVVVWGFSMGAGTALQAALQTDDSDRIDAMLLDSLFLPSSDSMYNNMHQYMKDLPRNPSIPLIKWMLPFFTGVHMDKLPVKQVMQTTYSMPLFIMHGTNDAIASVSTAEQIASMQKNSLSRSWVVSGGIHELLFKTHPKEYIQRAALFLSQVDAAYKTA
ncbi:alpha/beta hydrolase [Paenibacillus sacheonensis]|uniref:Alpha/beta fold hydrolase n=1 Tax=Paenibacillus sacheonensis TaxID=742054 RepID=A0A7X5C1Y4_9BACL|nr:alpha/beta fold hydrolase [Paenibacillus sacheonensis]MBM7567994.1 alpha-beta hydrolase superfamily lysophospholipase [Paenibacillus sacheonensis]NBC73201.1 alpha/beta fold hydrolase [Paenibacillus sacheonensis]